MNYFLKTLMAWSFACSNMIFSTYASTCLVKNEEIVQLLQSHHLRLIVMRHGEALHNVTHLMNSSRSPGVYLTQKGIEQVKLASQQLSGQKITAVYVSPVYRTLQTAEIVGRFLNIPYESIIVDDRLREQLFGSFENLPCAYYITYFPEHEDMFTKDIPNGESGLEVFERTSLFLKDVASNHKNQTVLIITHGHNCGHISLCLTGLHLNSSHQAEYKIYDFTKE